MANTVIANQIPIYGLIATGTGGIVALGGSSLGTKYGDMVQEMNPDHPVEGQILKNYSNAELAWKPVGFGIAETASALVDAHIMKGAARVLASATQPERRLISQTVARKLLDVGGQTVKGGVYEATDEMATQGVENLIDGKPFTEGMKDAGGAGGAMGALIPFFAGNIAIAAKPFSIDNKIQNSAKRTLALEKELANPSLSEDAKKIIQTNFEESKKTTENLLKKQVKDISKMSNENFQEVLRIENEQAKLKEKAIEIKTQEGLSKDIKKQLLSDFSARFNEIEVDRIDVLSGKKTMPKIEEDARPKPGNIEEKNGTFYVTDEKGITKGFATKEEAQAILDEIQEPTKEQEVEQLRADEKVKNAEIEKRKQDFITTSTERKGSELNDAENKAIEAQFDAEFNKIYDKYDELITPLLETEAKPTSTKSGDVVVKKPTIVVHGAVNGFGLQYSEGIDKKDIVTPKDARGFLPQEDQVALNKGNSVIQEDSVLENGDKKISIITPATDNFGRSAANTFEFVIPTNNTSTTKGIQSILDNVRNRDLKGKELIDETVKQVKEYINSNELTQKEAAPVTEKATTATEDLTSNKFEKSLTLLKEIDAKQGVDARNAKRERNEFLKENPTIKYIDDNYKNIVKQLEKQGLFKQLKDC
jgi:hypothetical protein